MENKFKCNCENSTGDTTVYCCNICGLPIPSEPWYATIPGFNWISVKDNIPPLIEGKDYSEPVWTTDGKNIFVMTRGYMGPEDGWLWGNNYGDVFGESECDDDYEITHWMPLFIPEVPEK